ncbi:MAG TPA: cyanophycin synthetase [Xanthomonadales bacterium]|nr:cyanophycin synthetase [Xanthomonadales bacterium]
MKRFGVRDGFHVVEEGIARGDALLLPWHALPLSGRHNALNVCAALTVLDAIGIEVAAVLPALQTFGALPHRLQPLGTRDGIEYVNDSIATTPYATLAALAFFADRRTTVIVGGYDRGVPWDVFRTGMEVAPAHAVVVTGQNAERIAQALAGLAAPRVLRASSLDEAMRIARELTPPGGVVLLSPGAPSFGEFRDYVERGKCFARLAGFDPEAIASIDGLGIA